MTLVLPTCQLLVVLLIGLLVYLLVHYLSDDDPPCFQNPCLNNGNCTVLNGTNDFSCDCPEGISGEFCQSKWMTYKGIRSITKIKVIIFFLIIQMKSCFITLFKKYRVYGYTILKKFYFRLIVLPKFIDLFRGHLFFLKENSGIIYYQ